MGAHRFEHSLLRRRVRPELMDQPGLDPGEHRRALAALARINRLSRTARRYWPEIARVGAHASAPVRVLDVACGGGDVAVALARLARRRKVDLRIEACDVSETALAAARERALEAGVGIRFFAGEAAAAERRNYDVVLCSLFLHHLQTERAVDLLATLAEAARRVLLVSDLVRSRAGYALAWTGGRLLTRSRVARHDGLLSVAAAFTAGEAQALAERAGLVGARVATHFPKRFLLSWRRS